MSSSERYTTTLKAELDTTVIWAKHVTFDNSTAGMSDGNVTEASSITSAGKTDMASTISYFVFTALLIFGLTGNLLTIIVIRSPKFHNMTSRNVLMALAVSDSLLLLTQPFNKSLTIQVLGRDLRALSEESCKVFFLIFRTSKMTSSWFVVYICIERFLAIWKPMKAKVLCTKLIVKISIAFVYVFVGGFNAAWTFSSKIRDGVCHPDITTPDTKDMYNAFLVIGSSIYSLIPIPMLCVFTPLIIVKLFIIDKRRKNMVVSNTLQFSSDIKKTSVTVLCVMIAYIILIFPITLFHNIAFYSGMVAFGDNGKTMKTFKEISQICEQINYSINFFLYVLTSSQFREHLFHVLCRCRNNVRNTETTTNLRNGQNSSTTSRPRVTEHP